MSCGCDDDRKVDRVPAPDRMAPGVGVGDIIARVTKKFGLDGDGCAGCRERRRRANRLRLTRAGLVVLPPE